MMHPDLGGNPEPTSEARRWANKYRDPEALENAYLELQTHSNRQHSRIQEMEDRMARLESSRSSEPVHDPAVELEERGIPVDDLRLLLQRELDARLNPIFEGQKARREVAEAFPDFEKMEDEVAQWLSQDRARQERYGRMFQADQAGAMEWALSAYSRSQGDQSRRNPDVGLPPSYSGGSRGANDTVDAESLQRELERAKQTGDWGRYVAMRLDQTTPSNHYDGLNR